MATLVTLAQYHMGNGDHMDSGWGWGMMALVLLALIAGVALIVWLVRSTGSPIAHSAQTLGATTETPMEILDRRLAQGEIAPDEYKERAAILSGR